MFDKDKFLKEVSPLFTMKIKFRGSDLPFNNAYMTDAKKNVVLRRLDVDQQFEKAWNFNYSQIFYTDMMQRLSNQSNITIRFYGDPNCLTGDTKVLLSDGRYLTIKEIVENKLKCDVVSLSLSKSSGSKLVIKPITDYFKYKNGKIIKITTMSGKEICCTLEHRLIKAKTPIKIDTNSVNTFTFREGDWTQAKDLKVNDYLCSIKSIPYKRTIFLYDKILKIEELPPQDVYDITIADTHNFIANGIVSHNSGKSYASIYLLQLQREFFDFGYHIVFSKGEAAGILATETYKAKHDELAGKFTILLDEDYKRFGVGSIQEMEYFQSMQEFLRRAQINLIMNNPFDISSAEIQFETVGYTIPNDKGESYTKSIVYYLVDKRNNIYSPMGYVLTKRPSLPYLDAYEQQKKRFLMNFTANRSPIIEKNKSLLEIIHNSMDKETQEMVKESIILGKDNDTRTLLWEAISEFNMPTAYTKQLIESYKMLYYKNEIKQAWEMKKQRILARQGG